MHKVSNNKKLGRVKKVKKELEEKDYSSKNTIGLKFMKNGLFGNAMESVGAIKSVDGIWNWIGGEVTADLVNKIYKKASEIRKDHKSKEEDKPKGIAQEIREDERPYDNSDIANMIEEFANQIRQDRAEILSTVVEHNESINSIKIDLYDLNQTLKKLLERTVMSDDIHLSLVKKVKDVESVIKKLKTA